MILDDLPSHNSAKVGRLIASAGAEVRYLPTHSLDLNPIEHLYCELKQALRSAATRTRDSLVAVIGDASRSIRSSDILS